MNRVKRFVASVIEYIDFFTIAVYTVHWPTIIFNCYVGKIDALDFIIALENKL